jgi:hypothetical protein
MTDLRDKLARPLIPILREASDLSVGEATVAASTLVNAQMPVVEEAIRQAGLKVLLESSTRPRLRRRRKIGKCQSTAFPRHQCLAEQRRANVAFARTAKAK